MKQPYFWSHGLDPKSREAAPMLRTLLTPLEALYVLSVRRRIARTVPAPPPVPVICVGNLTVGGVGKTPIVAMIRDWLVEDGVRAATLSRGYGGNERGPLRVDRDHHTARDVGDEPLMLASSGEAWIGRDRPAAAEAMARDGVAAIIMDDGHQNPTLGKTLSLVAIDAAAPYGNGHCLPKGPLREPVADGLARADGILIVGDTPLEHTRAEDGTPIWRIAIAPRDAPPDRPVVAFAGIGRPAKFFDSLTAAGADLKDGVGFDDHYVYTARDMDYLRTLAGDYNAALITTEKDYARLPAAWRDGILTWPIRAEVLEGAAAMREAVRTAAGVAHD